MRTSALPVRSVDPRPYERVELEAAAEPFPTRGLACARCGVAIPRFADLAPAAEAELRALIRTGRPAAAKDRLVAALACPERWAWLWVVHEGRPHVARRPEGPPCPSCGQPLWSVGARQCPSCGVAWHRGPRPRPLALGAPPIRAFLPAPRREGPPGPTARNAAATAPVVPLRLGSFLTRDAETRSEAEPLVVTRTLDAENRGEVEPRVAGPVTVLTPILIRRRLKVRAEPLTGPRRADTPRPPLLLHRPRLRPAPQPSPRRPGRAATPDELAGLHFALALAGAPLVLGLGPTLAPASDAILRWAALAPLGCGLVLLVLSLLRRPAARGPEGRRD